MDQGWWLEKFQADVRVVLEEVRKAGDCSTEDRWKREDDFMLVVYVGRSTSCTFTHNHDRHKFGLTLQGIWLLAHKVGDGAAKKEQEGEQKIEVFAFAERQAARVARGVLRRPQVHLRSARAGGRR